MQQQKSTLSRSSTETSGASVLSAPAIALFQAALNTSLGAVPYNSAAQFLEFFDNQVLSSNWGMSCVRQSVWIDEHLQSLGGLKGVYIRSGRHVASIYADAHGMVVLDPYLLHAVPLVFNLLERKGDCIETSVPAYPVRMDASGTERWGKLRAVWNLEGHTLQLDYIRFSPRRQQNYLYRSFTLSLHEIAVFPSPPALARARLVHPEQNNLSVRVLNLARRVLCELILPLYEVTSERPASRSQLISRNNQGRVSVFGSPEFEDDLANVAQGVGVAPQQVLDLLVHTAGVYAKVAPSDRVLAPYSLTSE
jgi:hypothetical protein